MKNGIIYLSLLVFCNFYLKLNAQSIFKSTSASIEFTTQAEIDSFKSQCQSCVDINEFVTISGEDITNLNGLNNLKSVKSLTIRDNPNLQSLQGLENLDSINYTLNIRRNSKLLNLVGLNGLRVVNNDITIEENPLLQNLVGLDNMRGMKGSLYIKNNNNFKDFTGLTNFYFIQRRLSIENNPNLISFHGLDLLENIGLGFYVVGNHRLKNCEGLSNLKNIFYRTEFGFNDSLKNFIGLASLKKLNSTLSISGCPRLETLQGLELVDTITENLSIVDNNNLNSLEELENLKRIGGSLIIKENDSLVNIGRFEKLDFLGYDLEIKLSPNLKRINAFHQLDSIGNLIIISNTGVDSLYAFSNLKFIGRGLTIGHNENLKSVPIFDRLVKVRGLINYGDVRFHANPKLEHISGFHNVKNPIYFQVSQNDLLKEIDVLQNVETLISLTISENPVLTSLKGFDSLSFLQSGLVILNNPQLNFINNFSLLNRAFDIKITNNSLLADLSFLSSLKIIDRSIDIDRNESLVSLSGLNNLESAQWITIFGNPLIQDLDDLKNLKSATSFCISNNKNLKRLATFDKFVSYDLSLDIQNNPELTSLNGFQSFSKLLNLTLKKNKRLENLNGLNNIESLEYLNIDQNDSLKTLFGLNQLGTVDEWILVINNPMLEHIFDLESLFSVESSFRLANNERLSNCSVTSICNLLNVGQTDFEITNNMAGCNDTLEVKNLCSATNNFLNGKLFADIDCDTVFDPMKDVFLPNRLILNTATSFPISMSNINGEYDTYFPLQSTLEINPKKIDHFSSLPTSIKIVADTIVQYFSNRNFNFCPDSLFHNITLTVTSTTIPRPGFTHTYQICVENLGIYTESAQISLEFIGSTSQYVEILDADGGTVNGHTITWDVNDIQIFEKKCFSLEVRISPSTPLGTHIRLSGEVVPVPLVAETDLEDNVIRLDQLVVGSYDPNNKTTDSHKFTLTQQDSVGRLDYTIRFQNTGTYPAEFVEVYDTLESNLDIRSIEMIDASHAYTLEFPTDNVLKWRFDNINLADSASNEAASHGFIRFAISTKANLPLYTPVQNAVSIYFDYNERILTDTSLVTACPPLNLGLFAVQAHCGDANGIGVVQAQNTGSHSYLWSNGTSGAEIHDVAPGDYTVTVTGDVAACSTVGFLNIGEIAPPVIEVADVDTILCFGDKGKIDIEVTAGSQPYQFLWSNGATMEDLHGIDAGTYQLFFEDGEGCMDSSIVLSFSEPHKIEIEGQVLNTSSNQHPNGAIFPIISGGVAPYALIWSTGDTTLNLTDISSGNYALKVIDANGCEKIHSFVVNLVVNVANINENHNPFIFPNPTNGILNIHFSEKNEEVKSIKLNDFSGRTVLRKQEIQGRDCRLDLSSFPNGFYLLEIENADGTHRKFPIALVR